MNEIRNYNGRPTIFVNGEPIPPMMATVRTVERENREIIFHKDYFENLGKSGVRVFFLICNTLWLDPGAVELFDKEARLLLEAIPDAYIMVRLALHPTNEWIEAHPEECLTYSDGSSPPIDLKTESYSVILPHHYSLCSQKWREDSGKALEETWLALKKLPYADHIIGCFLAAGHTSEWYYRGNMTKPNGELTLDHSLAFRREFSKYLKDTYGTDENLQKHWKNPNATLENPPIPEFKKHYYTSDVDHDAFDPKVTSEYSTLPSCREALPAESNGTNIGTFVDMDNAIDVYDFYRAWHIGVANSVLHFAKIVKKLTPDAFIGAFYGSQGCINYLRSGTNGGTRMLLDSPYIDFLAAPGVYENRGPGGAEGQRQVQDSFFLHNKVYIVEQDTRTVSDSKLHRRRIGIYDMDDSLNVMKREFGRNLCEDVNAWWFDQILDHNRYRYPEMYQLMATQQRIAREAYEMDRTKKSEIAFVFDEESFQAVSLQTTNDTVELMRNYEIAHIGAPVDQYYHNDLSDPNMPSYKMYVFFNTFVLTAKEREAIRKKLAKDHALAIWIYAPGFADPEAEKKMSAQHMSELTGINMKIANDFFDPTFRFNGDYHPISDGIDRHYLYGKFDWRRTMMMPSPRSKYSTYIYPLFYADDPEAVNLGHYLLADYPAVSVKETPEFTSVYFGSRSIRYDLIRHFALYAGCHIYIDSDDVLYAGPNHVTLHASSSGKKMIRFPEKVTVTEVYENKCYGENTDCIEFEAYIGETKMFRLDK